MLENNDNCTEDSWSIVLSDEEVQTLNAALPEEVVDGLARGPAAIQTILLTELGQALCEKHLPEMEQPL